MDIFETLRIEHAAVRDILDKIIDKSDDTIERSASDVLSDEDWPELFHDLKLSVVAHNRAEEAVFYDVLNRIPHRSDLADLKTEEHHIAEELIEDLEEITPADSEWPTKLALLKNQLESHIADEETSVFSVLQPVISDEESEDLVIEFEKARDEIYEAARSFPSAAKATLKPASLDLKT